MKRVALSIVLSIGAAGCMAMASTMPTVDQGEAGVRDVENGWGRAFVTGDAGYLDALLDPSYVSVGAKGIPRSKVEIIALSRAFAAQHPDTQPTPLPPTSTIAIKGTAAVVTHHSDSETSVDVFYYANGRWKAWYSQHTPISTTK